MVKEVPKNDGGNVFPTKYGTACYPSLTLRDYFAAAALQACIAKCGIAECLPGETIQDMFARRAYEAADAMITASKVKNV